MHCFHSFHAPKKKLGYWKQIWQWRSMLNIMWFQDFLESFSHIQTPIFLLNCCYHHNGLSTSIWWTRWIILRWRPTFTWKLFVTRVTNHVLYEVVPIWKRTWLKADPMVTCFKAQAGFCWPRYTKYLMWFLSHWHALGKVGELWSIT